MNSEVQPDLSWKKYCVLIEHHNNIKGVNFMTASTKLHVPVVTLSIHDKSSCQKTSTKDLIEQYLGTNIDPK